MSISGNLFVFDMLPDLFDIAVEINLVTTIFIALTDLKLYLNELIYPIHTVPYISTLKLWTG